MEVQLTGNLEDVLSCIMLNREEPLKECLNKKKLSLLSLISSLQDCPVIHFAAALANRKIFKILIDQSEESFIDCQWRTSLFTQKEETFTPLQMAIRLNNYATACLIDPKIEKTFCTREAIQETFVVLLKDLLGNEIHPLLWQNALQLRTEDYETILHYSAKAKGMGVLKQLIAQGGDPGIKDRRGMTPMHAAIEKGQINTVRYLALEQNVDLDMTNVLGTKLLTWAITVYPNVDFISQLLNCYKEQQMSSKKIQESEALDLLIKWVNQPNSHGYFGSDALRIPLTPLMVAMCMENYDIVKYLCMKARANVDWQDSKGWSVLHYASNKGSGAMVHLLLELGANPRLLTLANQTPLQLAQQRNYAKVIYIFYQYDESLFPLENDNDCIALQDPPMLAKIYDDYSNIIEAMESLDESIGFDEKILTQFMDLKKLCKAQLKLLKKEKADLVYLQAIELMQKVVLHSLSAIDSIQNFYETYIKECAEDFLEVNALSDARAKMTTIVCDRLHSFRLEANWSTVEMMKTLLFKEQETYILQRNQRHAIKNISQSVPKIKRYQKNERIHKRNLEIIDKVQNHQREVEQSNNLHKQQFLLTHAKLQNHMIEQVKNTTTQEELIKVENQFQFSISNITQTAEDKMMLAMQLNITQPFLIKEVSPSTLISNSSSEISETEDLKKQLQEMKQKFKEQEREKHLLKQELSKQEEVVENLTNTLEEKKSRIQDLEILVEKVDQSTKEKIFQEAVLCNQEISRLKNTIIEKCDVILEIQELNEIKKIKKRIQKGIKNQDQINNCLKHMGLYKKTHNGSHQAFKNSEMNVRMQHASHTQIITDVRIIKQFMNTVIEFLDKKHKGITNKN